MASDSGSLKSRRGNQRVCPDRNHHCSGPSTQCRRKKGNRTKECIGRSSGGLTTKIDATCDALGNLTGFHLSLGQAHDLQGADVLLVALLDQIETLLANIAYTAKAKLLVRLEEHQVEAVILPKSNQK